MSGARPLWQELIEVLAKAGTTREIWPGGRDRPAIREILWELYLLGERPTLEELLEYVEPRFPRSAWRKELVRLWAERLQFPARVPKSSRSSRYPFALMDGLVPGGRTIVERLAETAIAAVNDFAGAVARDDDDLTLRELSQVVDIQVEALRTWGRIARVREHLEHGPAIRPRSKGLPGPIEDWRMAR